MRTLYISMLLLGVIGCGGGGGGNGDTTFSGRWRGSVALVKNTCPHEFGFPQAIDLDYTINQAGRAITIDNNSDGTKFLGELDSDGNGFVAEGGMLHTGSGDSACSLSPRLAFNNLRVNHASVQLSARFDCVTGVHCEFGYAGDANR